MAGAFMTDPGLLSSVDGQQYLVLRPRAEVGAFYEAEQARLRGLLPDWLPGPNTGHVTLRGFHEPRRVDAVRSALAFWAKRQAPIDVSVDGLDGFPPPFQVLIARLERTRSLVDAYASLTSALDATDFRRIGELPLTQWVFHLSLLYCSSLTADEWAKALRAARRKVEHPREVLTEAEFVWYQDGVERSEVLTLSGAVRS